MMTRVLVIDDDPELRATLADALRDAGFDVAEAGDGRAGLKIQQSKPVDVVVSDIFMAEQDGIETIFELRSTYPALKIISISGGATHGGHYDYLPVAKELGADRCLRKPFKIAHLVSTIRELLEGGGQPGQLPGNRGPSTVQ